MTAPHLGVVDWGIGGLGVLGLLDGLAPALDVTYWSDTGATPYGMVPTRELRDRLRAIVDQLAARGCTEVLLACNAASTVAPLLADAEVPVQGIIEHGIRAVPADASFVGVVAGRRTVRSGAYRRGLDRPGRRVASRVAQPLSAHIEAGRIGTDAFDRDLRRIVAPLRGADVVVLACTHYPAATEHFAAHLPGTRLVDPAGGAAAEVAGRLAEPAAAAGGRRRVRYATTGDPEEMVRAARLAWGRRITRVARVGPLS
ncbi:MAG: aspartate/glutamate racemase family protein [Acidimicrobiales bacterium]